MAGADSTLGTKSKSGSERCSPDSVQRLATCLCYAKGKTVSSFSLHVSLCDCKVKVVSYSKRA